MIYDTSNNPLYSTSLTIKGDAGVATASVRVDCATGRRLTGSTVDLLTVEAKHSASAIWTDIEAGAIDLGTWNGTRQTFQIRLTGPNPLLAYAIRVFRLTVGP